MPLSQSPYIGGNQTGFTYTNPFLMQNHLSDLVSDQSKLAPCENIKGLGFSVMAIKKFLQAVDHQFNKQNRNSFVQLLTLLVDKKKGQKNRNKVYKLVFQIKTFLKTNYIGLIIQVNPVGFPGFQIIEYVWDEDQNIVCACMGLRTLRQENVGGFGDLKQIYTQYSDNLQYPSVNN